MIVGSNAATCTIVATVLRRTAAEVLEAERGFRMLTGYRARSALVAALRAHHTNRARSGVDQTEKAA
jgi:hypothetical protein